MSKMQTAKAMRDQGASYDAIAHRLQISTSAARAYVWRAKNPAGRRISDQRKRRRYARFGDRKAARLAYRDAYASARRSGLSTQEAQSAAAAAYKTALIATHGPSLRSFVEVAA